jgi:hypothetical protein
MRKVVPVLALALVLSVAGPVCADEIFMANLTGSQETPPNPSPALGFGTFALNDTRTALTFDVTYGINARGPPLLAGATASHFHNGPIGVAAPVVHGVPITIGSTSGELVGVWDTTGPEPLTPFLVSELEAGNIYFNIHSQQFPGGEIRGQLGPSPAPEPSTLILFGIGGVGLLGYGWRRRKQA